MICKQWSPKQRNRAPTDNFNGPTMPFPQGCTSPKYRHAHATLGITWIERHMNYSIFHFTVFAIFHILRTRKSVSAKNRISSPALGLCLLKPLSVRQDVRPARLRRSNQNGTSQPSKDLREQQVLTFEVCASSHGKK